MAKQVIVLKKEVGDDLLLVHGVAWVSVPASYQAIAANPLATSQYVLATSAELASIQLGQIAEVPFQAAFLKTTPIPQMKTEFLRTASLQAVTFLSSQAVQLQYYGVFWDGATWSA